MIGTHGKNFNAVISSPQATDAFTPPADPSSKIIPDASPLAEAQQASRLYDSMHDSESVDGIELLLAAEQVIALTAGPKAEDLLQRIASAPSKVKSNLGGHDHLWAALVLMQQGKFADAAKHFEQAMVLGVRHWRLNCYLASALAKSDRIGEAFLALTEARPVAGTQTLVLKVQQELLDAARPAIHRKECSVAPIAFPGVPTPGSETRYRGYEEVRTRVEAVPGLLCSGQEEFLFNKVCSLPDDAIIVEIGSFKGRSTVAMGLACVNTKRRLLCIDTWDVENWEGSAKSFPDGGTFAIWQHSVSSSGLDQHVAPIRGNSHEVLTRWHELTGGKRIDFIFIDGSHDYANVLRDFELVLPWVKPGGWIAFHDVVETWPGPLKVWREHASSVLQAHEICSTIACGQKPVVTSTDSLSSTKIADVTLPDQSQRMRNFVISGTNYWNPGDDFVRDGVIQVLRQTFPGDLLNFHFYNFAEDQFPKSKFRGIGNEVSAGDLELCRDFIDGVIIAGLSAGHEIKDLYNWVLANGLEDRVFLIGGGYENSYCAEHVLEEPEATVFRKARIIIGRTACHPRFITEAGTPYVHLNCPALLSVPEVKPLAAGRKIQRIGFSIQLPHETGIVNQTCDAKVHRLACQLLLALAKTHEVELIAHHKSEYFLFLHLLRDTGVPVIYSSFYQDLHEVYRRYDCVVTTRLHSSLYANGHGIPGIIVNDTDRHTHTLSGFPHSVWVNTREAFDREFARINRLDLAVVSTEMDQFKAVLTARYVNTLRPLFLGNGADCVANGIGGTSPVRPVVDKLNIGCGSDYREGFLNLDGNAKLPKVDVVLDVRPGVLPGYFARESFRHILAKDFLEHHTHWEAVQLLKDFRAVLKPGGELELLLPNVEVIINDPNLPIGEKKTSLYGGQDITQPWECEAPDLNRKLYPQYFCHKFGWTPDDLRNELLAVGFDRVEISPVGNGWNMHVRAFNPDPSSCLADGDEEAVPGISSGAASAADAAATYQFDSEKKEQLLVRSLVKPGMTVLDVGAHLGKYTKLFSLLVGEQGRVFSFEPTPASARKLADRIASDHLNNVTLISKAVCDHNGIVTLHQFPEEYSSWNGLGRPSMEDPRDASKLVPIVGETEVAATTLDEFCQSQGLTHIDYLKLDVEGAEIHALRGAVDLLSRQAIGCLQFEVSRKMLDGLGTSARAVFEFLARHGYECHSIRDDGKLGPVATDSESFFDNYAAFPVKVALPINPAKDLPINFFTIVLNGQPFIRHHIETLRQLPFQWHWHIIEGVAELKHDTGWSVVTGGRIPDSFHKNGLSVDGTTEYLDELKRNFPDQITIHRPPAGKFWDGKREMVNAPLASITGECLLWQLDADELWTATQIIRCRALFLAHPEKTAAMFFCHYFVGPDRVITSRDTYGNHSSFEWLRVWRFQPGDRWIAHEPPRLGRAAKGANPVDVGAINPIRHADTEAMGLVFHHYAYATEAQVRFKQDYYGYPGAVAQWEKLQAATTLPCPLADYFGWVKDGATVDTVISQNIQPLELLGDLGVVVSPNAAAPQRILFVRTDSIGDAVLASSMLPWIQKKYPRARISVLCQEHVADVYLAAPMVSSVICVDRKRAEDEVYLTEIISEIAEFNPQLVLNSTRSRDYLSELLTLAFRGARHICIEGDSNNISAADRAEADSKYELIIPSPQPRKTEISRHADFLRGIGIQADNLQPLVWTTADDEALADAFFQQEGLNPVRTIGLFPGAQFDIRVYPGYSAALAEFKDFRFLIFGDESQSKLADELASHLGERALNLCGRTTLPETAAILRRCRLYVGAESAGAHIACAEGVPNVVLLGGGHFGRFMPYSPLTSVVVLPLDCFGCNWDCPHVRTHCVKDVSPEVLTEAIRQTLARPSAKPRVFIQSAADWNSETKLPAWQRPDKFLNGVDAEIIEVGSVIASDGLTPEARRPVPLVSVLISTYAAEKYLRACLEDLETQTIADKIEIIVIDSGSPQNERAIVEEFQLRYSNIRYVRTERETLYAAWNRGVQLARGQFITNANSDDSHRADALELLVAALEAHPEASLAYGDYSNTSAPNDCFAAPHVTRRVVQPDYHPAEAMFYCPTGCHPMWRRTVFEQIGLFDTSFTAPGDYEFLLRFIQAGLRAVHLPECLSLFYQNPQGLSWKSGQKSKHEWAVIQAKYRAEMPIERLFRVNPADARSKAEGWVAFGNLALNFKVPWFENFSHDLDFALNCYETALKCDPESATALYNLALARVLKGNVAEGESLMRRLPPERFEKIVADIKRGRLELAEVDVAPAAEPLSYSSAGSGRREEAESTCAKNGPLINVVGARTALSASPQPARKVRADKAVRAPGNQTTPRTLRMPVRWVAPFHSPSEYAADASDLVVALNGLVDLATQDQTEDYSDLYAASLPASVKSVLETTGRKFNFVLDGIAISERMGGQFALPRGAKFNIGRTTIESDRLPLNWARACNQMDEIWVPSRFTLDAFAISGVERDKLVVVPVSVDATTFRTDVAPIELPNRAAWNYLSVCEWNERAGWDVLLAAYFREFSASDDVCLYVLAQLPGKTATESKTKIQEAIRNHIATLHLANKSLPRIEVLEVAHEDLPRLYRAADCVVVPAPGDGWGRVTLEAMWMGLPVIATDYGAHQDFATESNSYPLACELAEIRATEPELLHLRGLRWANPPEARLRELLRRVQQNPAEAKAKGRLARASVKTIYGREHVAEQVVLRLAAIEQKLTIPACPAISAKPPVAPEFPALKPQDVSVAWEGSFLDAGSLSHVNREVTRQLACLPHVQLSCAIGKTPVPARSGASPWPEIALQVKARAPKQTQVTVRHEWPPNWERPASGLWVLIQPWEFGVLPLDWCQQLARVDQVWVYSDYVRRVYVDSGVDPFKVKVVPLGIDPEQLQPSAPPLKLATNKSFKFLFVGGTIHRKGPDLLLKSFLESFTAADDVCLVIKDFGGQSVYAGQTFEAQIKAAQSQPNAPEILYLNEELPPESLPGLYTACDCLVHPYRGEGFGLPVLEAMACGLPVVVTGGGATDDFATDEFAYRLPALRKEFGDSISGMKLVKPGWLLEPDANALGERLKWIVTHRVEARAKGTLASDHVRREWTWARAAKIAEQHLQRLVAPCDAASTPPRRAPKALTLPPVARFGNLVAARELLSQGQILASWNETLSALSLRPYHPEAFLLLAEIARTAGDPAHAKALAEHARKLAPKWKPAQQFLKSPAPKIATKVELPPLADSFLTPRASRLTVCLITKNEERFLGQCLESIRELAQQIVVVDTGSTDRTVEIARQHGAEVYSFAWCDDFSAARNTALERATGDWILFLDADEELLPDQREKLRKLMQDSSAMAFRLPMIDVGREAEGVSYLPRLFRNAPGLFFLGCIHEHVFLSVEARRQEWGLGNKLGDATLLHHGYTAELMQSRGKSARNLKLLQKALLETPDDPNLLMNLGLELARAGRSPDGIAQYDAAFRALSALPAAEVVPEFCETLLTQFCTHLVTAKDYARVARVLRSPLAWAGGLTATLHWLLGLALIESMNFAEGAEQMRQCLAKRNKPALSPVNKNIFKGGPSHCLALCLVALKQRDAADKAFRAALQDEPTARLVRLDYARFLAESGQEVEALNSLHQLIAEDASDVRVWHLGGHVALSKPEFLEFACDWTSEAMKSHANHPAIVEQRATALLLSEKADEALPLWKRLGDAANPSGRAAIIICEALLDQPPDARASDLAGSVIQEFISWYRRLLGVNASRVIEAINQRMEPLRSVVPEAVRLLEAALAETSVGLVK